MDMSRGFIKTVFKQIVDLRMENHPLRYVFSEDQRNFQFPVLHLRENRNHG